MPNRKDQSTYDADYVAVKEVRKLANVAGIVIVLVHHLRKADADDALLERPEQRMSQRDQCHANHGQQRLRPRTTSVHPSGNQQLPPG